jgi:transposase
MSIENQAANLRNLGDLCISPSRTNSKCWLKPKHLGLHLIVDNCATHSRSEVQKWLAKHRRFFMHFTPTSASWLNMVERFFRDITDKRIRRDSFTSVAELELAIDLYVAHHNSAIPSHSSGPRAPLTSWPKSRGPSPPGSAGRIAKTRALPEETPISDAPSR